MEDEKKINEYKKKVTNGDLNALVNLCLYIPKNEAFEWIKKVLAEHKDDPFVYYHVARAYDEIDGCEKDKIKYMKKHLSINPCHSDGYWTLGNYYYEMDQWEEAEECYLKGIAYRDNDDYRCFASLGSMYYHYMRKYGEAETLLLKAIEGNQEDELALETLGRLYFEKKCNQKALENLEKARRLYDENESLDEEIEEVKKLMDD